MDYKEIMYQMMSGNKIHDNSYLCSGEDPLIAKRVLDDIISSSNGSVVVVDDSGAMKEETLQSLRVYGYAIFNGFSKELCFENILDVNSVSGMSKIRTILSIAGFSEMQAQKVISYLSFIKHVEVLVGNQDDLSLEILSQYSGNMCVERRLNVLKCSGAVSSEQQMYLLSKYAEVCAAAADFEHVLLIMGTFITGNVLASDVLGNSRQVLYIPLYILGRDLNRKRLVMELLTVVLSERIQSCRNIMVFDNGREQSDYLSGFVQELQYTGKNIHLFSQDIFLSAQRFRQVILKNADIRIFSKHKNMASCAELEKLLGEMDVVKQSYSVDYPRQWRANSAFDILLGNNKTEHYTWNAPVREPKYRKEEINSFPRGVGIVELGGNSSIFSLM